MPCRLESSWELWLFVGCTEDERRVEQPIGVRLRVESETGFRAQLTDELHDTLDVAALRHTVTSTARASRVRTLERMGTLIEEELRKNFPQAGIAWELELKKPRMEWTYVQTWRN